MALTNPMDLTTPDGGESPRLGNDRIIEVKKATQEIIAQDHYAPIVNNVINDDCSGEHVKVSLRTQATAPTNTTGKGFVYSKDVSGITECFYKDSSGNEKQITTNGKLNLTVAELNAIIDASIVLSNDTWLKAKDLSGNAVNLICAGASNPSFAVLSTNAQIGDQTNGSQYNVINKGYVDTQVATKMPSGNNFGTRITTYTKNVVYHPTTDCFINAFITNSNDAIYGCVSANSNMSPQTLVAQACAYSSAGTEKSNGIFFVVKKNEYFQIATSGSSSPTIILTPFGV